MLDNVKEEVNELEITERAGILKLRRLFIIANWFPELYKEKNLPFNQNSFRHIYHRKIPRAYYRSFSNKQM